MKAIALLFLAAMFCACVELDTRIEPRSATDSTRVDSVVMDFTLNYDTIWPPKR